MPDYVDPFLSYHFSLDMGGKIVGLFTQVRGLSSENEVVEHKTVNDKGVEMLVYQPGRLKMTPITLKRGITDSLDIWKWRKDVELGKLKDARKPCSILAYTSEGKLAARWDLVDAWPSKITGPEFDSTTGAIMFEEVTIVFNNMSRTQ